MSHESSKFKFNVGDLVMYSDVGNEDHGLLGYVTRCNWDVTGTRHIYTILFNGRVWTDDIWGRNVIPAPITKTPLWRAIHG